MVRKNETTTIQYGEKNVGKQEKEPSNKLNVLPTFFKESGKNASFGTLHNV